MKCEYVVGKELIDFVIILFQNKIVRKRKLNETKGEDEEKSAVDKETDNVRNSCVWVICMEPFIYIKFVCDIG